MVEYFFGNIFDKTFKNNLYIFSEKNFDKKNFGENIFDENIFCENIFDKNIFCEYIFGPSIWSLRVSPLVTKVPLLHIRHFEVKCDERTQALSVPFIVLDINIKHQNVLPDFM